MGFNLNEFSRGWTVNRITPIEEKRLDDKLLNRNFIYIECGKRQNCDFHGNCWVTATTKKIRKMFTQS